MNEPLQNEASAPAAIPLSTTPGSAPASGALSGASPDTLPALTFSPTAGAPTTGASKRHKPQTGSPIAYRRNRLARVACSLPRARSVPLESFLGRQ